MVKVYAKFVGAVQQELTVATVADVKAQMNAGNSTATVNGEVKSNSFVLEAGSFVVLSEQVKGNMADVVAKTSDKQIVVTKLGKHKKYTINGVQVTGKQLEKLCLAILSTMGYND